MRSAAWHAFAKINVDLRVLGKRPDGYHELRTVFQTISLADRIAVDVHPASDPAITIEGNTAIDDNLIARAARLVFDETRTTARLHFHLHKHIPMGAGLGGGSSDAASVLLALPELLGVSIPPERLHHLAATLGSDVPFFLYGGTAVGLGRGEELYPLPDLPPLHGLLVAPDIHVSTAEAYRALSAVLRPEDAERKQTEFGQLAWTENLRDARNDFEAPVFSRHPELAHIRSTLEAARAACARMSGSGSSLFGLFRDESSRTDAQSALAAYRTVPFALLNRAAYRKGHIA